MAIKLQVRPPGTAGGTNTFAASHASQQPQPWCAFSYLWLVGNGGMKYNYNYCYYQSSIPY